GTWDGESGAFLESWNLFGGSEINGVAVDNSASDWAAGDVLVASGPQHTVDVVNPEVGGGKIEARLEGTGPGEPFNFPKSIAVDSVNGDLFIVDFKEEAHNVNRPFIDMFEPGQSGEYKFVRKIIGTPDNLFGIGGLSVAVDGSEKVNGKEGQLYAG